MSLWALKIAQAFPVLLTLNLIAYVILFLFYTTIFGAQKLI